MQDSRRHPSNWTRRNAMAVAGAALTAATTPATGAVLAQAREEGTSPQPETRNAASATSSVQLTHRRSKTNGITLHYVTAGRGPVVLCMHGRPQNHSEFVPVIARLADSYTFIAPDLRGYADSDKPFDGYEPKTIAQDKLGVLDAENVQRFHILSHDWAVHLRWRWPILRRTERCRWPR
jgi:alpha/beta hydrolase fold